MASKIEDYGLIGNTETAALVSRDGSIDWLCTPRFDSDACFSALVGYDEHGSWALRPIERVRENRQRYREGSMVLETEFVCDSGAVRIIDFMPVGADRCDLVRIVVGLEGEVALEMLLNVRFGYGANDPWIAQVDGGWQFVAGPDSVVLRTPTPMTQGERRVSSIFTVKQGQRIPFQLTWHPSHKPIPSELDVNRALDDTDAYWRDWSGRCTYQGRYRDAVVRSLLTLKAMTYAPTGAIVAAPTTSLPEGIGGVRNWDYRFCWLRDASLTLDALMVGGYLDEARAFRDWLMRAVAGAPEEAQIMYNIEGGRRLTEFELDWLPGYEGSKPVRVGNAASGQFQLDVYGEVMSSLYLGNKLGIVGRPERWHSLRRLIEFIEKAWQEPDDGIWEMRGGRRHFTHSKVMAWVAVDRCVRGVEEFGIGGDVGRSMVPHLKALRERMHEEICQRGWNPRIGSFSQYYGGETLDASLLVIPHMGFLPPNDPRVVGTVKAVEKALLKDGFVLRYETQASNDGLPGTEGAFLACSFWLADCYAFTGRHDEAQALFERLLGLRNHLGLLAEEYDPKLQRQVGNFPQAFSHLALISTATVLDRMAAGKAAPVQRGEVAAENVMG